MTSCNYSSQFFKIGKISAIHGPRSMSNRPPRNSPRKIECFEVFARCPTSITRRLWIEFSSSFRELPCTFERSQKALLLKVQAVRVHTYTHITSQHRFLSPHSFLQVLLGFYQMLYIYFITLVDVILGCTECSHRLVLLFFIPL